MPNSKKEEGGLHIKVGPNKVKWMVKFVQKWNMSPVFLLQLGTGECDLFLLGENKIDKKQKFSAFGLLKGL